jgi:hypothetical protein
MISELHQHVADGLFSMKNLRKKMASERLRFKNSSILKNGENPRFGCQFKHNHLLVMSEGSIATLSNQVSDISKFNKTGRLFESYLL